MAFDSVGMARKAQNRLCKAPWSRVNNEKRNMREYWMWSRNKEMQEEEEKKKHLQAWRLIINRECHKVGALGLYGLTKYDSILQQACLCACVCTRASTAAVLHCRGGSQTLLPREIPHVWVGSRNNLIGLSALSFSWSPILQHKWAHTHSVHTFTQQHIRSRSYT